MINAPVSRRSSVSAMEIRGRRQSPATDLAAQRQLSDQTRRLRLIHRETIDNLRAGERYQDAIVAVFSQDMPSLLAEVRCPILLLCGDRDVLYPYLQPACADRPDAKCVTLDGGSYVIDQDPARVAAELRSFLQSIDGA